MPTSPPYRERSPPRCTSARLGADVRRSCVCAGGAACVLNVCGLIQERLRVSARKIDRPRVRWLGLIKAGHGRLKQEEGQVEGIVWGVLLFRVSNRHGMRTEDTP